VPELRPELAPELWSAEVSQEPELELVPAESELELEQEQELVQVVSGLEQDSGA
jgi:hypothetical protein